MAVMSADVGRLLELVVKHIEIPPSLYEKAAARHRSLGEWLCRNSSTIRHFSPDVRPQGSFRLGLVTKPLTAEAEYDLDNVCVLTGLSKGLLTQKQLKHLYGEELRAYAKEHGMIAPVEEHHRCWRLRYADRQEQFHLDSLPCLPEDAAVVARLVAQGVPLELASKAVAITDRRHPEYDQPTNAWTSSNPRGFAKWFEQRAALARTKAAREGQLRAAVEDVPPYSWKTPLQKSIQILKRHRDVMFEEQPDLAPISMIITNLAARSYDGETDLVESLLNIVELMPTFIHLARPRVPNPTDPLEDYADKWSRNSTLERNFRLWHAAAKRDIAYLAELSNSPERAAKELETKFRVILTGDEVRSLGGSTSSPVVRSAPALVIPTASRPWGHHE